MSAPLLRMEPWLRHLVWGGDRLATAIGHDPGDGPPLAEIFEASGLASMSSTVSGTSTTLRDAFAADPAGFLGAAAPSEEFPLLLKRLDAGDWLSVQVHPDDAAARRLEAQACGKEEAWIVLDAARGAELLLGFEEGVTLDEVSAALEDGSVAGLMRRLPVVAGDVLPVPPGCAHAIGPGVVIFEAQQPSDLTYRLWDWGRKDEDGNPRETHVEKGLEVIDVALRPSPCPSERVEESGGLTVDVLCRMRSFRIERWRISGRVDRKVDALHVFHVEAGQARLSAGEAVEIAGPSDTLVVPARARTLTVETDEEASLLVVVPRSEQEPLPERPR